MISAGIDVGSYTTKVVILNNDVIIFHAVSATDESAEISARQLLEEGLEKTGLAYSSLSSIVVTGIGRESITFATIRRSEQLCHARGAYHLYPSTQTVVDLGHSGIRAISLDSTGKMVKFATNPKCAAGTGVFLESIAHIIGMPVEQMGTVAAEAKGSTSVTGYCAVFAESEVISHIHRGEPVAHIVAGIHESAVNRVIEVIGRAGIQYEITVTGGVAKNKGVIKELERKLGLNAKVPEEPQIAGALGAALVGQG